MDYIYQKLVDYFLTNEYREQTQSIGSNIICNNEPEQNFFITFIILNKTEMADVFLKKLKVNSFYI
jgi:hypothetical protein